MRRLVIVSLMTLVGVLLILPSVVGVVGRAPARSAALMGSDSLPIKVYFPVSQQIQELKLGEYLKGVVAAEMPPDFADEALKAQLIVARTYAVRRMQRFAGPGKGGCPPAPDADICADPAMGQAYMTKDEMVSKLGAVAAVDLLKRLDQVQAETEGLIVKYQGEPIDPLYHSVSGTMTEDAGDYFAQSVPYLKPVDDHWGADAPKLVESRRFTPDEVVKALANAGKTVPASAVVGAKNPVQILSRTASGRAKTVKLGGVTLSAREFRERLGLRSTDLTITAHNGEFVVQTKGYGHGVGMSQYGANGMAKAGKSYKEILTHYYTGVTLGQVFEE